jgi:hypothetical protein
MNPQIDADKEKFKQDAAAFAVLSRSLRGLIKINRCPYQSIVLNLSHRRPAAFIGG